MASRLICRTVVWVGLAWLSHSAHPVGAQSLFTSRPLPGLAGAVLAATNQEAPPPDQAAGPPDRPAEPPAEPGGESGLSRRDLTKRLGTARRLMTEQRYSEGVAQLQRVLDNPQDDYVPAEQGVEKSVKTLAEELLLAAPAEVAEIYEAQYGPTARRLLTEAGPGLNGIEALIDRYLHTEAGYEALYRQGARLSELGQPQLAVMALERLRGLPRGARRFEPQLSTRVALLWHQLGDRERSAAAWNSLPAGTRLTVGGEPIEVTRAGWDRLAVRGAADADRIQERSAGWLGWRGDARHNGVGRGGGPYLNQGWRVNTLAGLPEEGREGRVRDIVASLRGAASLERTSDPSLTLAVPLVIGDLVVSRTLVDLRAYDRRTGRPVWSSFEKDRELTELLRPGSLPQSNQTQGSAAELLIAQRFWSDINFNAISSDGERVYAVEDLGYMGLTLPNRTGPVAPAQNRLVAHDLRTGKTLWEAGSARELQSDPLAGAFFLGSPVSWMGRLYALIDLGSAPHLAVLHPATGELEQLQPLGADEAELNGFDRSRWLSGLSPVTVAGVLICPTGPDSLTAYDPARRRLLWRYRLRPRVESPGARQQMILLQQQMARNASRLPEQGGWIDYGCVADGDRILITPRDSDELFCLDSTQGTLLWKAPRGTGLYLGGSARGVVVVVGRDWVQGFRLQDGKPAWAATTVPVVTGKGCLADDTFLVPLASGEVAAIQLADGQIRSRSRSFSREIPGSLAMAEGTIVSARYDDVAGYRQVEELQAEIEATLARSADDVPALTIRGQMRLERGDYAAALTDLERAVALAPDSNDAKSLLLTALLEGLRQDFGRYSQFASRVGELAGSPADRVQYHRLMAAGYERLGERGTALGHLLQFVDPTLSAPGLERIEPTLQVSRDVQVTASAERLLEGAEPAERAELERRLRETLAASLQGDQRARAWRCWELFGSLVPSSEPAALAAALQDSDDWLKSELLLHPVLSTADANQRERGWKAWGQLLERGERWRDLGLVVDQYRRTHPGEWAGEGAGPQMRLWGERPEVQRIAGRRMTFPAGKIESERQPGVRPVTFGRTQPLPIEGNRGPFLAGATLELLAGEQQLVAKDSQGQMLWKLALETPVWGGSPQFNRAWVRDHLVVVLIGKDLFAADLLGAPGEPAPRWLWHRNLIEGSAAIMVQRGLPNPRGRINFAPLGPDQTAVMGPLSRDNLAVLRGRQLSVLDPLTGQSRWQRDGVAAGSGLFGDDDWLLTVPPDSQEATLFRTRDGQRVGTRPLPPPASWLEPRGSQLMTWSKEPERSVLRLVDVVGEREIWSREFAAGAFVSLVEGEEAVVVDPAGRAVALNLASGTPLWESALEPLPQMTELQVHRRGESDLLITNQPLPAGPTLVRHAQNVAQAVHGRIHLVERQTGKLQFSLPLERLQFDPQQPADLPLLVFASHVYEPRRVGNGLEQRFLLTVVDRATGKLVYDESRNDEPLTFIDYRWDADAPAIELQLFQSVVRFTFTGKPGTAE